MYPIITSSELSEIFHQENLVILDARTGKQARENYLQHHIKGARFIDLDHDLAEIGENAAFGGRHPLPTIWDFAKTLQQLGISQHSHVVIYDTSHGANAAARCWWMLRSFGLDKIQVLSGGLKAAEKMGIPMDSGEENAEKSNLISKESWSFPTSTMQEVEQEISHHTATVIDVRDSYRYNGESEPIDLVAGHIPGAVNFPFSENLDKDGQFLSREVLKEKYTRFLEGKPEKLIIHCGSGVTACHTILALTAADFPMPNLYVGSWSEWSRNNKKIEKKED